jgi:hypothetical protein
MQMRQIMLKIVLAECSHEVVLIKHVVVHGSIDLTGSFDSSKLGLGRSLLQSAPEPNKTNTR